MTLVIVTGSRDWEGDLCERIMKDRLMHYDPSESVLMHGNARGADRLAHWIAQDVLRWRMVIPVPYMDRLLDLNLGKRGGPARNEVMARIAAAMRQECHLRVHLLAFPTPSSRGTWDCVRQFDGVADQVDVIRLRDDAPGPVRHHEAQLSLGRDLLSTGRGEARGHGRRS